MNNYIIICFRNPLNKEELIKKVFTWHNTDLFNLVKILFVKYFTSKSIFLNFMHICANILFLYCMDEYSDNYFNNSQRYI
jgi:hypothetical protein